LSMPVPMVKNWLNGNTGALRSNGLANRNHGLLAD
jgi:hypothetical protein